MSLNGAVIFKGAAAAGVVSGVTGLPAGTRLTTVLNITDAQLWTSNFDPVAPTDNTIVQNQNTDLSAKTFIAFF